ncbi:RNA polymerase RpoH-like sigma 32 subunit [Nitrosospira sp. Nsp5]|jgi:RNA polymerase sigma-32 factor|uniref:RNA polymerase sigma factor RpoH n=1 Tax=Nitrosospira multiformis TaxID=1231 RepID=A0ABY0T6Z3_9PROT|nr:MULTISPECIES: RNA polymerase sigma factor RpoH [Nitrosospira]PTR06604.1 RNA polymerase RpoH-like sigma 32 subunit [Nitrosospira sp. Nsp5]SCY46296.1 RNA polymerase, sigma 32 subunit, RpoH [Nitrosospira sp. Nsp13]SDQ36553.1 RNA polymerase, sigma 32 subunit, RpoH [Nitrosospira multiformis]
MTFALAIPSAGGSIESYIQSVNRFRILSQEEEVRLARSLRDEDSIDAARQLVLSHLRVVVAIARGYKGYGLPQADLIQEGNIGLMKAVKRYDPERGVRLVSFAVHWIKAEIHEFILRNWRLVKIATTKAQRKLFFNLRSMKPVLDTMNPEEVNAMAKQLGVKAEEVVEMETRFNGRDISLEPLSEDEDETFSPIAYLTDGSEPPKLLEAEQTTRLRGEGLEQALASLDARSRHIIEARWLRENDTATLHDLADELGVSAERIRQIEAKAMEKMRGAMATAA